MSDINKKMRHFPKAHNESEKLFYIGFILSVLIFLLVYIPSFIFATTNTAEECNVGYIMGLSSWLITISFVKFIILGFLIAILLAIYIFGINKYIYTSYITIRYLDFAFTIIWNIIGIVDLSHDKKCMENNYNLYVAVLTIIILQWIIMLLKAIKKRFRLCAQKIEI